MDDWRSIEVRDLLDLAIQEADGGPADFGRWRELARTAIQLALGEDSELLSRFDLINFARPDGIITAVVLLQGVKLEFDFRARHQ